MQKIDFFSRQIMKQAKCIQIDRIEILSVRVHSNCPTQQAQVFM